MTLLAYFLCEKAFANNDVAVVFLCPLICVDDISDRLVTANGVSPGMILYV